MNRRKLKMWGDEVVLAAKIHIIVDCWGIPFRADYESGQVNSNGFTEADVPVLLSAVLYSVE